MSVHYSSSGLIPRTFDIEIEGRTTIGELKYSTCAMLNREVPTRTHNPDVGIFFHEMTPLHLLAAVASHSTIVYSADGTLPQKPSSSVAKSIVSVNMLKDFANEDAEDLRKYNTIIHVLTTL